MKNRILLMFSMVSVLGCDRLKVDEQTKIQIQLPQAQSVMASKNSVTTLGGRPVPSGFTGETPINCYLIAAGGPEESMQRNTCGRKDSAGVAGTFVQRKIGPWVGAAPAGTAIGIDVPSGKDRVIYVVGFHAISEAACRDFRANGFPLDSEISYPYLMAEKGGLELKPGETKDLPLEVSFKEENRFDGCDGPDFPNHDGDGDGGPSTPTQLLVTKEWFPYRKFASNQCQSFDVVLKDSQGRHSYFTSAITFTPTVFTAAAYQSLYFNYEDCQANINPQTTFTLPPYSDRIQVVFKTHYDPQDVTIAITSITSPSPLTVAGTGIMPSLSASATAVDLEGPDSLLPDVCYPMNLKIKQVSGGATMNYSSISVGITYGGAGVSLYSTDATCQSNSGPLSSISFGSGITSLPVYIKLTSSAANETPITFHSASLGTANSRVLYRGGGSTTPLGLEIRGWNQMGGGYQCATEPHEVFLVNDRHVPLIAPVATSVALAGSGLTFYNNQSDCAGPINPITSLSIPAGAISGKFYIRTQTAGMGSITASAPGLNQGFYGVNVNGPATLSLTYSGPSTASNNECIGFLGELKNANGSLTQNYPTTLPVTVTGIGGTYSYTLFGDVSCSTSLGSITTPSTGPASQYFYMKVDNQSGSLLNLTVQISATAPVPASVPVSFQVQP